MTDCVLNDGECWDIEEECLLFCLEPITLFTCHTYFMFMVQVHLSEKVLLRLNIVS